MRFSSFLLQNLKKGEKRDRFQTFSYIILQKQNPLSANITINCYLSIT